MENIPSVTALLDSYKAWVCNNPNVVTDVETVATWSSYFVAGKINKSPIVSELVYALSKLLSLFNDRLIRDAYGSEPKQPTSLKEKLKLWLTVLHYCEVFIELAVRRKWGGKGKWTVATLLQLAKCSSALVLLYKYEEVPLQHPAIPVLQRRKYTESKSVDENGNGSFTLKRSGRMVRCVEGAPLVAFRDWQPIQTSAKGHSSEIMSKNLIMAETLHIMKPLAHLAAMSCFGAQTWKQWAVSLGLDLASLNLYGKHKESLTSEQKIEVSRRKLGLLLYLLRSPMYNKYTEDIIAGALKSTAKRIPVAELVCNPILQYLKHWQDIYFYMWTS